MKTLDIEIALLEDCKFNQNIVVPNVPFKLLEFAKGYIPENAGLAYAENDKIHYVIDAPIRENAFKWTNEEMFKLAKLESMRIYNLKRNIAKLRNVG